MERKIYQDLINWKNSEDRKPLVLQGARQVGKTYIVNLFGAENYANVVYCNFEKEQGLKDFFTDLIPQNILKNSTLPTGNENFCRWTETPSNEPIAIR